MAGGEAEEHEGNDPNLYYTSQTPQAFQLFRIGTPNIAKSQIYFFPN